MSFAWPHLLFLIAIPLVWLTWEWLRRQRLQTGAHPKILHAEASRNLLRLQDSRHRSFTGARLWLGLGLIFAVIALARPQWGRIEEPVFDQSREILIAIDLSSSMLAQDVKPDRLQRAKLLISSLLEKLAGERVGLAVFSGTAFLQCPLSADYEILRDFLPALNPDYLPEGGTNYRALLDTTLQAFSSSASADRFLIVLSDGEATDDNWQELIPDMQKKNIRVIGLGIGTPAGAMIPDGEGAFVKDDRGAVVLSKLESATLQKLAQKTNGAYRDATSWIDLASLIKETVDAGRKGEFVEQKSVRLVERYQWALAPALLCLLISFWREFPVRPRPRDLKISTTKTAALAALFTLAGLALTDTAHAAAEIAAPEVSPLGKIVSRLSVQDTHSGRDWAELARETVTWGQKLQTENHPVPAGPVHDALHAVDAGSQLDPQTAEWTKLRAELQALLRKPDDQNPQDKPDDQKQDQSQDQEQSKDQQKQDQSSPKDSQDTSQAQDKTPSSDQSKQDQNGDPSQKDQSGKPDQQKSGSEQNQSSQSAFGDMQEKTEPPSPKPSQGEMQKVGGAKESKDEAKGKVDPALAMPLQKLQTIRNADSPAELFQLMEGKPEPSSSPPKGKTW